MKRLIFPAIIISVFVFLGCRTEQSESKNERVKTDVQIAQSESAKTEAGNFTIDFKTEPQTARAGEPTELAFTIKNSRGETVKDVQIVHEKPMHLLVVSEDLSEFYHVHPEAQADGVYRVSHEFPNGGNYRLYADFSPLEHAQIVRDFPLIVAGNERAAVELKPDAKLEKTVDGLRVALASDGDLAANKELMLNFQVFDAATNKPASDLENYLGARAHFVVISQDLRQFVHAHPMSSDNTKASGEHAQDEMKAAHASDNKPHAHGDEKLNGEQSESIVSAHVTFPIAGIYKIFAQFKRGGRVSTVPFVVAVKPGAEEKAVDLSKAEFPDGAMKIVVSRDGFTPSEISYKQGAPLKLAFFRTDSENCAGEVIFKDLQITRKLPVGRVVTIDIPTDASGEFAFACGMNMYKGKIIVQ